MCSLVGANLKLKKYWFNSFDFFILKLFKTDVDRDENSFVDVQIDADGIIGNFLAEVEQISELIEQIKLNVRDVKNLHNSILTSPQTDNSEFAFILLSNRF